MREMDYSKVLFLRFLMEQEQLHKKERAETSKPSSSLLACSFNRCQQMNKSSKTANLDNNLSTIYQNFTPINLCATFQSEMQVPKFGSRLEGAQ